MFFVMILIFMMALCFFISFDKKLIPLLCLEGAMILFIFLFFFIFSGYLLSSSFFSMMIFLIFMVLDSVLGISLLVSGTRSSLNFSFFSS